MSNRQEEYFAWQRITNDMRITDEKLVEDFLSGDNHALEVLVDRYLKPLFNFVAGLTRDNLAAEDIVQEVFVKAWKNMVSFDTEKKFSTWVFAIAKNASFDWLKKKKAISFSSFENEEGVNVLENIEDTTVLYSEALFKKMDDAKDAQEFLDSLSPEPRAILLLHHIQGIPLAEIAEIMSQSPNSVKSRYRRAILSLRNQFFSKNGLSEAKTSPRN